MQAGHEFQGIAVRPDFDGIGRLSHSVGKANLLIAAAKIWREGCGKGVQGRICRAQLLADALCLRLAGSPVPNARSDDTPLGIATLGADRWPDGLMIAQFEIPDRDVFDILTSADAGIDRLEPAGIFNPESLRPGLVVWRASSDRQESEASAAQLVANLIPPQVLKDTDAQLLEFDLPPKVFALGCEFQPEGDNNNFTCGEDGKDLAEGLLKMAGARIAGGQFTRLQLGHGSALRRVEVSGAATEHIGGGSSQALDLRQSLDGLHARLLSGLRISAALTRSTSNAGGRMDISVIDDLTPMRHVLLALAKERDESIASLFDGSLLPAAAISSILPRMPDVMHLGGG